MIKPKKYKRCLLTLYLLLFIWLLSFQNSHLYGIEEAQPIIIDGDIVEYSADAKEVTADGNVVVTYQDARLTCDKITVNTQTKDAVATGNVRLEEPRGILEAEELKYNFQNKTGDILTAKFRSSPYYYFGSQGERMGTEEFIVRDGYFSSCNYDQPHFRMKSKEVKIIPGDKIIARSNSLYWMNLPFFFLPGFSRSLKDPFMKLQVKGGKTSDWGPYILTAWRHDLNESVHSRLYLDWREDLGAAYGWGLNYDTKIAGKGDFKFYYTQERPKDIEPDLMQEYQRYMLRLRHMWDIGPQTKLTAEYYRIDDDRKKWDADADFLRDYFYREYERDEQPKSYILVTHTWPYSNMNMIFQKRTNRWYDKMTEKLPEVSYYLHNYQIAESPVYFKNESKFSNFTLKHPSPSALDDEVVRFDTYNQFTLPTRFMFLDISPYVGLRETAYNKDNQTNSLSPRTTFYTGVDLSTKFYRIFNVEGNLLGINIDKLRHVISPKVRYGYIHEPTISPSRLTKYDGIDAIDGDNRFVLELENKLQTKRENRTIDLLIFRVSSDYVMYSKKDNISKAQDRFTEFLFDLELRPFAWWRMEADATYNHLDDQFETVNLDNWLNLGEERSFGLGHRYDRDGGKELTTQLTWRVNPKWSFRIYERYQFASSRNKGLVEQEYTISRDLHCATIDVSFNITKKDDGRRDESIWCVFNLKIFKESEFDYVQSYHPPKSP
jgi:LPS-assembly protein